MYNVEAMVNVFHLLYWQFCLAIIYLGSTLDVVFYFRVYIYNSHLQLL